MTDGKERILKYCFCRLLQKGFPFDVRGKTGARCLIFFPALPGIGIVVSRKEHPEESVPVHRDAVFFQDLKAHGVLQEGLFRLLRQIDADLLPICHLFSLSAPDLGAFSL